MIKMIGFQYISKSYYGWKEGVERNGDSYELIKDFNQSKKYNADCYYQTNMLKPKFMHGERYNWQGSKYEYILNTNKPYIVSESEPFREYPGWLRFGWNDYGWAYGNFNNENVGPERWNKFESKTNIKIKDWRSSGDNILIMGQKEGDSALVRLYEKGYKSFYDWVEDTIKEIRIHTDRPIVVRPHPRGAGKSLNSFARRIAKYNNVSITPNITRGGNQGGEGLNADLESAYCVVTFNSLSSIEAVIRGIPVFATDGGCMAWPISHKSLSQIEYIDYNIDITEWKNKIAYTFWNKQEVKFGECWAHLKQVYFKD